MVGDMAEKSLLTGPAGIRKWSGAGSNRRHSDFQSDALPTELPDQGKNVTIHCTIGNEMVKK
tara:strand:+ start:279 stop:464 length:186 start_codon:yes stop_codon:yes gene_type:complete